MYFVLFLFYLLKFLFIIIYFHFVLFFLIIDFSLNSWEKKTLKNFFSKFQNKWRHLLVEKKTIRKSENKSWKMSLILNKFLLKSLNNSFKYCLKSKAVTNLSVTSLPFKTPIRQLPSWGPPKEPVDKTDIEFRVLQTLSKHDKIDKNSVKKRTIVYK